MHLWHVWEAFEHMMHADFLGLNLHTALRICNKITAVLNSLITAHICIQCSFADVFAGKD